jgi:hypothetical protein
MFSLTELNENAQRVPRPGCAKRRNHNHNARRHYKDPDKALIMSHLARLVADGYAEWAERSDGDLELRFYSGQRFLLARHTITRIA